MQVKYDDNGDIHEENIDKYGDVIYKQKDCKWLKDVYTKRCEHWIHEPTGRTLIVPVSIDRHWRLARRQK